MYVAKSRCHAAALFVSILTASPAVCALQVNGNVGVDTRYTDNATLVPDNETEDVITTGTIGGTVSESEGALTGNASASFRYLDYLDNTFDNQTYFRLGASAGWEQIENVLRWNLNDYFSQASVNALAADTPANTEDINVINLAAQWNLRPADRHQLTVTPSFSDYYYEISNADNQQAGLAVGWSYQWRPTVSLSLTGGYRDVTYDDDTLGADHTSTNLNAGLGITRPRARYGISVGARNVDRDSGGGTDGLLARLTARYDLSARSTIDANLSTDITDTSNAYLDTSLDPNAGNFGNIQTSSDVVRNSLARVAYSRKDTTLNFSAWVEWRKLDYQATPNDREVHEYGANVGYRLTQRMSASVRGTYVWTGQESQMTTDKFSQLSGQLGYALSRKLSAQAGVQFRNRENTLPQSEYDEISVFAGLGYHLGR